MSQSNIYDLQLESCDHSSVQDLELYTRVAFGAQGRNHNVAPVPFRDVILPSKLKFGYFTSDNFVKTSPACKRAVLETIDVLRKKGHECIEIEIPSVAEAFYIFVGLTSSDGYRTMLSHIGPDPQEPALRLVSIMPKLPQFVRSFMAWLVEFALGDKFFADGMRSTRPKPMHEYTSLVAQREEFTRNFYKEVWEKYAIDGIISPVQAIPQLPHGGCNNFLPIAGASAYYNVLGLPAGIVPVTRVDAEKDLITEEWWNEPGHGSKLLETGLFKGENALYKPKEISGMPIAIQIAGQRDRKSVV